jgi:hypothetical protein
VELVIAILLAFGLLLGLAFVLGFLTCLWLVTTGRIRILVHE